MNTDGHSNAQTEADREIKHLAAAIVRMLERQQFIAELRQKQRYQQAYGRRRRPQSALADGKAK
jgi:hypothetical protein